jgi:hypothetical protein
MQTYGADRCREVAGRLVLHSRIPKGWTARTPATLVHAEHPGTTVLWEGDYFEVVEAALLDNGGVRYVLLPWRDDHTIRTFEAYDEESERRRIEDHDRAMRQRRASVMTRLSGIALGHLPARVQNELQNELGVSPTRMTLLSCIPPFALFGVLLFITVGAFIAQRPSPVPTWLFVVGGLLAVESLLRFWIAMSRAEGIGSFFGTLGYVVYRLVRPRPAGTAAATAKGESIRFTPPPEEVEVADAFEMAAPFLTLLPAVEQRRLAELRGLDYRRHAFAVAIALLVFSFAGAWTSYGRFVEEGGVTALISTAIAAGIALEQAIRLVLLSKGPAGSILGLIVRPFARNLLAKA